MLYLGHFGVCFMLQEWWSLTDVQRASMKARVVGMVFGYCFVPSTKNLRILTPQQLCLLKIIYSPKHCFVPSYEKFLFPQLSLGWEVSYSLVELHCWNLLIKTSHISSRRGVFWVFLCKVHLIPSESPLVIFLSNIQSSLASSLRVCISIWVSSAEFAIYFCKISQSFSHFNDFSLTVPYVSFIPLENHTSLHHIHHLCSISILHGALRHRKIQTYIKA